MQRAYIRIKCKDICLLFSSESKSICPQRAFCLRSRGKCTFTEITRFLPSDSDLKPFYSVWKIRGCLVLCLLTIQGRSHDIFLSKSSLIKKDMIKSYLSNCCCNRKLTVDKTWPRPYLWLHSCNGQPAAFTRLNRYRQIFFVWAGHWLSLDLKLVPTM